MRVRTVIESSFVAGLVLVAPLVVTIIVLRIAVNWLLGFVNPIVQGAGLMQYTAEDELVAQILATAILLVAIVTLGYLAQRRIGQLIFGNVGRAVTIIPLVGTIYSGVRQVATSLTERDDRYESVVLVEYPREGTYVIGFVTGESPRAVRETVGGSVYNVFIPNSPNPTGGRLLLVPEDRMFEIDMSLRRGVRMLVTTGMASDESLPTDAGRRAGP